MSTPKVGAKYRHYKGGEYLVIALGRHSETHEDMVFYQNVHEPEKFWARPLSLFIEDVEQSGVKVPRFEYIGE